MNASNYKYQEDSDVIAGSYERQNEAGTINVREEEAPRAELALAHVFTPLRETMGQPEKTSQKENMLENVDRGHLHGKLEKLMECVSNDGTLIWRIDNFKSRLLDAQTGKIPSFHSLPFFTNRQFGYKICARIYLNGDGIAKGTYLSLFFVLMRSKWDALLPFPFKQKITFKLLSQDGDRNKDIEKSFYPSLQSSSFQQPSTDMNIAYGCPMFVPNITLFNGAYVRNDSICVVISVDTSGLPTIKALGEAKVQNMVLNERASENSEQLLLQLEQGNRKGPHE